MNNRRGFTLIELTLSMVILMMITGAAVQFLRRQTNLVTRESGRMEALQNAQFAANQIERELRQAGAGVVDMQPMIVQLDAEAITFNANMVAIDPGDVHAVYRMTDADPSAVRSMTVSEALALPNSSPAKSYPDTNYTAAIGVASSAETISYWLRPDSSSTLPNRYVLFRRVNALAPTLVARGIVKDAQPIFTYYVADTLNQLVPVPTGSYPIYHGKVHGAVSDTGRGAMTDSIRAVRIHFLAAARDPRTGKDGLRTVESLIRLMNAGLLQRTTCGQPPYGASGVAAVSSVPDAPVKTVTLSWTRSTDDGGGEKDIQRYAIFRRLSTEMAFGDPIASIPASVKATYSFVDTQIVPNQSYVYGVSAQDCTPLLSGMSITPLAVLVNP